MGSGCVDLIKLCCRTPACRCIATSAPLPQRGGPIHTHKLISFTNISNISRHFLFYEKSRDNNRKCGCRTRARRCIARIATIEVSARQSQMLTPLRSLFFFKMKMACKQHLDLRCVLILGPSTLCPGAKTRLGIQNKEVYTTLYLQGSGRAVTHTLT